MVVVGVCVGAGVGWGRGGGWWVNALSMSLYSICICAKYPKYLMWSRYLTLLPDICNAESLS